MGKWNIYRGMKKLIITEIEKDTIREMYGLINEETIGCKYEDYQNGDGVTKPKITVTKSPDGVDLTYEGPETGFCIQHSSGSTNDSMHQLAGVTRVVVSPYLKELYEQGTFVYPDLKNIEMTKRNEFFSIKVPFVKTTEDKAITNFNERGGWGHKGKDTLNEFLSTISDRKKYGKISIETKVASGGNSKDITEHWVSFRDLEKYPIKSTMGIENKTPFNLTSIKSDTNTKIEVKPKINKNIEVKPGTNSKVEVKPEINKKEVKGSDKIVTNYDRAYDYKLTSDNKVMFKGKEGTKYGAKYPEWTDPLSKTGEDAIRTKVFKQ